MLARRYALTLSLYAFIWITMEPGECICCTDPLEQYPLFDACMRCGNQVHEHCLRNVMRVKRFQRPLAKVPCPFCNLDFPPNRLQELSFERRKITFNHIISETLAQLPNTQLIVKVAQKGSNNELARSERMRISDLPRLPSNDELNPNKFLLTADFEFRIDDPDQIFEIYLWNKTTHRHIPPVFEMKSKPLIGRDVQLGNTNNNDDDDDFVEILEINMPPPPPPPQEIPEPEVPVPLPTADPEVPVPLPTADPEQNPAPGPSRRRNSHTSRDRILELAREYRINHEQRIMELDRLYQVYRTQSLELMDQIESVNRSYQAWMEYKIVNRL